MLSLPPLLFSSLKDLVSIYFRLLKIYHVAVRYGLFELLEGRERARLAVFLLRLPLTRGRYRGLPRGVRLRRALEELGPIFIKFGQLLSTRRDLVPADIADELALLQDRVPPFPGELAARLVEASLGADLPTLFREFSPEPLASASIAQVHTATLHSGEEVVVKVIRPGVEKIIAQDIALLHSLAGYVERFFRYGYRLRPREVVRDYERIIFDELDLLIEAANTSQLGRNFADSEALYVPQVHWDYCSRNILVMERIHGIPVSDVAAITAAGINLKKLAETGVEIFFTQVLEHNFFHADMHPGNIFVSPLHPEQPQYIAIDCAIIGTLSYDDQQYLARNLLAIFQRDYRKVAELHVASGWVPRGTPVQAFEATIRSVCEPIFEKPLKDISFGMILLQLFQTARRFDMEVQPSLVLLQKTLLNIEGLGKQLYPELNLWQTALPFLERWQQRRLSPLRLLRQSRERLPEWVEQLPELPEVLLDTVEQARHRRRDFENLLDRYEADRLLEKRLRSRRKLQFGIAALLLALAASHPAVAAWLAQVPLPSLILLGVGATLLHFRL